MATARAFETSTPRVGHVDAPAFNHLGGAPALLTSSEITQMLRLHTKLLQR